MTFSDNYDFNLKYGLWKICKMEIWNIITRDHQVYIVASVTYLYLLSQFKRDARGLV